MSNNYYFMYYTHIIVIYTLYTQILIDKTIINSYEISLKLLIVY